MTDKKLQAEVTEWMDAYFKEHFPEGLPENVEPVIREIAFDCFLDGVRYGQDVVQTEGRIVIPEKWKN